MNGEIPAIPIISLAGIASLSDFHRRRVLLLPGGGGHTSNAPVLLLFVPNIADPRLRPRGPWCSKPMLLAAHGVGFFARLMTALPHLRSTFAFPDIQCFLRVNQYLFYWLLTDSWKTRAYFWTRSHLLTSSHLPSQGFFKDFLIRPTSLVSKGVATCAKSAKNAKSTMPFTIYSMTFPPWHFWH